MGVFFAGLLHQHLRKASLKRGVLFDVLAVLVECCGTDATQLPAGQCWLQHIGGVHRALGIASPDQRVQLVDEQHDHAIRILHLVRTPS